jgi:hypothetical protein
MKIVIVVRFGHRAHVTDSEMAYFDPNWVVLLNKDILWLDIPVYDFDLVQFGQPLEFLITNISSYCFRQGILKAMWYIR